VSRLHHLALRVADVARAARFYSEVLGLACVREHRDADGELRSIWLDLGGSVLMLERAIRGVGPDSGSAHVLVLVVDDLEQAADRLAHAGVQIVDRTAYTLFFADPDGHRVGLSVFAL
jgi:catechol 2,3-dioxygenase-like lactoylglutathione lyase family enzyme